MLHPDRYHWSSGGAPHYVTREIHAGEEYTICRSFSHSFRENGRQTTALWLLLTVLLIACAGDFIASGGLLMGGVLIGWSDPQTKRTTSGTVAERKGISVSFPFVWGIRK